MTAKYRINVYSDNGHSIPTCTLVSGPEATPLVPGAVTGATVELAAQAMVDAMRAAGAVKGAEIFLTTFVPMEHYHQINAARE